MSARPSPSPAAPRRRRRLAPFLAILVVGGAGAGLLLRHRLVAQTPAPAAGVPTVATATVVRRDLFNELSIQAEFRPYQEVELHAKVSGYLQSIAVDFGDRVREGELVATLEVPELKDDMESAAAAAQRAAADYRNAHLEYTRLEDVNRRQPNLVAQQDLDVAEAKDGAAAANLAEARSGERKYQTLWSYTRITAPFSGVITQRNVDPGALIQAGTSGQARPVVRISENDRLRLDFPVSISYASQIVVGEPVQIQLEGTGRTLSGRIARSNLRIATDTRTMEAEVEVANSDLKLIPGMYATAILQVDRRPGALAVPVEGVSGGAAPTAYVIGPDGRLEERKVALGIETPGYYEVLSGLAEGDRVMIGGRAGVTPGQVVVAQPMTLASSQ